MKDYNELREMFVNKELPALIDMPAEQVRDYIDFRACQFKQAQERMDKFGTLITIGQAGNKQHQYISTLYAVAKCRPDVQLTEDEKDLAKFQN